jgi:hypothetical protein
MFNLHHVFQELNPGVKQNLPVPQVRQPDFNLVETVYCLGLEKFQFLVLCG